MAQAIYSYLDYRKFLKDRFAHLKQTEGLTYRSFNEKAGFSSPNFLKLVIEGQRNLTEKSIPKICQALKLSDSERQFFEALVQLNQAKSLEERELVYEHLKKMRPRLSLQRIEHAQYEYLEHWYTVAIRELTTLKDFQEDPAWIQNKLGNKVGIRQIRSTLKLLERLKLIERGEDGKIKSTQAPISTGDEVSGLGVYRFHQEMIDQAKNAHSKTPQNQRDISALTVAVNEETFRMIKSRIQGFRKEILALCHSSAEVDAIYQLNFQLFNLSEVPWEK